MTTPYHACWQCGADLSHILATHTAFDQTPEKALATPSVLSSPSTAQDYLNFSALQSKLAEQEFRLEKLTADNETLQAQLTEAVDQQGEQERITATAQMELKAAQGKVQELQEALDAMNQQRVVDTNRLQSDMQRLAEKLIDETEKRGEVEHDKIVIEHQIEDLSRSLIEEAQNMVRKERIRNDQLDKRCQTLQRRVDELDYIVDFEREQSADLKHRLADAIEERDREVARRGRQLSHLQIDPHAPPGSRRVSGTTQSPVGSGGINPKDDTSQVPSSSSPLSTTGRDQQRPHSATRSSVTSPTDYLPSIQRLFEPKIAPGDDEGTDSAMVKSPVRESVISQHTNGSRDSTVLDDGYPADGGDRFCFTQPLHLGGDNGPMHLFLHLYLHSDDLLFKEFAEFLTLHNEKAAAGSPYLRRCFTEDVEPCLRFGSALISSTGSSLMLWRHHRKLLGAVQNNSLIIETVPVMIPATVRSPLDSSSCPPLPCTPATVTHHPLTPISPTQSIAHHQPAGALDTVIKSPNSPITPSTRNWTTAQYLSPLFSAGPAAILSKPNLGVGTPLGPSQPLTIHTRRENEPPLLTKPDTQHQITLLPTRNGEASSTVRLAISCFLCESPIDARPLITTERSLLPSSPGDHHQSVYFRYRLDDDDPERRPLCHHCRQRLRSVCDFYAYVRMITRGLLTHVKSWRVYAHLQYLRHNMTLARLGSLTIEAAQGTEAGTIQYLQDLI
ncbi:hypothetical protein IWQ62_000066 [Dispira parvispora]|uniref:GDP/GTP exchange factor Sec2 N-terminal domain-containing protein n=1 Tax=Dispira parvispora TaxID=1520584 RepID=A0A9W8E5F2_9FUNG|nr:hypothetical protein IWQ62_000066 [Dispira parvispora]